MVCFSLLHPHPSNSTIDDLLRVGYSYVLLARLLADALERHFSKYRQMSGGRFLVSLLEVSNSERILKLRSILKEDINFWEEDVTVYVDLDSVPARIKVELFELQTEILEAELGDAIKEVAVTVSGYVAKKLVKRSKCSACPSKLISKDHIANDSYLTKLSRGGLICLSPAVSDFVSRAFSILDMINPIIQKVSSDAPPNITTHTNRICRFHVPRT